MHTMPAIAHAASGVILTEVLVPEPAPGEARVRVHMVGVCRTDILAARGEIRTAGPVVLGHEFAGTIDKLGLGVESCKVGQRVAARPIIGCKDCPVCHTGDTINCPDRELLGIDRDGAFAEFVRLPADCLYSIPDSLGWQAAAYAEPVAAALAVFRADVRPSDRVLILGKNRFAMLTERLLRSRGVADIRVASSDAPGVPEGSFDKVIETALGRDTLRRMIRAARPGGTLVLKSRQSTSLDFNPRAAIRKQLTIHAVNYGSFPEALSLLTENRLDLRGLLGDVYPLDAFEKVFDLAEADESAKLFFDPTGTHARYRG